MPPFIDFISDIFNIASIIHQGMKIPLLLIKKIIHGLRSNVHACNFDAIQKSVFFKKTNFVLRSTIQSHAVKSFPLVKKRLDAYELWTNNDR